MNLKIDLKKLGIKPIQKRERARLIKTIQTTRGDIMKANDNLTVEQIEQLGIDIEDTKAWMKNNDTDALTRKLQEQSLKQIEEIYFEQKKKKNML